MNDRQNQLYLRKAMYTSAGCTILQDNFDYCSAFVNTAKIAVVGKKICDIKKHDFHLSLTDYIGCASDIIIHKVAEAKQDNEMIFLYEDEHFAKKKFTALYAVQSGLFIFCDNMCNFKNILNVNLSGCYNQNIHTNRKYSTQDYNDIARYFFEKAEESIAQN